MTSTINRRLLLLTGAVGLTTLTILAQAPAPTPAPAAGQTPAPGAPGGRGRGPSMTEPDFSKKPPVVPLTPAEEAKRFWLPPGFKLEPVLADPDIEEPAQIAFDGNGRMFVLEL